MRRLIGTSISNALRLIRRASPGKRFIAWGKKVCGGSSFTNWPAIRCRRTGYCAGFWDTCRPATWSTLSSSRSWDKRRARRKRRFSRGRLNMQIWKTQQPSSLSWMTTSFNRFFPRHGRSALVSSMRLNGQASFRCFQSNDPRLVVCCSCLIRLLPTGRTFQLIFMGRVSRQSGRPHIPKCFLRIVESLMAGFAGASSAAFLKAAVASSCFPILSSERARL